MSLKRFRPQRVNANKHTERGIALLEKSIQKDGWIGAITVAADGETFDGSARLETVGAVMGESEPIVVDVDGTRPVILRRTDIESSDDPRAKRLAVAANAIASADWNPDGPLLAALAAEDDMIAQLVRNDDKAAKAVLAQDNFDPAREMGGMPEFEMNDLLGIVLSVHFLNDDDNIAASRIFRAIGHYPRAYPHMRPDRYVDQRLINSA